MCDQFKKNSWNKSDYIDLQKFLYKNADEAYREFNKRIVQTKLPLIGVRVPIIRKLAKYISKGNIDDYLNICEDKTFEEALLHGLIIASLKCEFKKLIKLFDNYVDIIENWAICDMTVSSNKSFLKNQEQGYEYAVKCINSANPWKVRVGLILMLSFYINENYIDSVIKNCKLVSKRVFTDVSVPRGYKQPSYYVKMGNAWLLSVCFVKFPEKTKNFLKKYEIDKTTYNMTVQKIVDSKRVLDDNKIYVKKLKNNYPIG